METLLKMNQKMRGTKGMLLEEKRALRMRMGVMVELLEKK